MDTRIRRCSNQNCDDYKNKKKYKATDLYCTKCGAPTVFVCVKCFDEIEDLGPKHRKCARCEALFEEKKQAIIDKGKDAAVKGAKIAGTAVVVVASGAGKKILNFAEKESINRIVDAAKPIVKNVFKG